MSQLPSPPKRPLRRAVMVSIGVSVFLHGCLLGILLVAQVMGHQNRRPFLIGTSATSFVGDEPGPVHLPAVPPKSAGVDSHLVRARVAEMVSVSQQQSTAENLSELAVMSRRLGAVASDRSLRDLADHFQQWMGLAGRAAEPRAAAASDPFDVDSAQFHDVKRLESSSGQDEYYAVLIDAGGRTLEIELTKTEGRDMYELMQRLKANPLLEKIYRSIAMPLLDNLIHSVRAQAKSAKSAESARLVPPTGEPEEQPPD